MKEYGSIMETKDAQEDSNELFCEIRFLTPGEAQMHGVGNLFNSKDNPNKRYAVGLTFNRGGYVCRGALIDLDMGRYSTDEEYRKDEDRKLYDLFNFTPPPNL